MQHCAKVSRSECLACLACCIPFSFLFSLLMQILSSILRDTGYAVRPLHCLHRLQSLHRLHRLHVPPAHASLPAYQCISVWYQRISVAAYQHSKVSAYQGRSSEKSAYWQTRSCTQRNGVFKRTGVFRSRAPAY